MKATLILTPEMLRKSSRLRPNQIDEDRLDVHATESPQLAAKKRHLAHLADKRGEVSNAHAKALQTTARLRRRLALEALKRKRDAGFMSPPRLEVLWTRLDKEMNEREGFDL
jgi:hypothetical protein